MAIGKNKRLTKGKKGGKKKIIDVMSRKDWFDFKAPAPFDSREFGKTCITKTTGTRISTEIIKGRVVEVSLADLKNNSDNLVIVHYFGKLVRVLNFNFSELFAIIFVLHILPLKIS